MLPPTVKQFFFKLLISIFVHDYKNVLRQYRQAYTTQRQMEQYLRVITPEDLYDKELVRISERMSDLQKLIYQLRKKGLSDEAISRKLNLPLHKIQKHLDLLTSSSCHPKIFIKEFCNFLVPCHQHCLRVNVLVQR